MWQKIPTARKMEYIAAYIKMRLMKKYVILLCSFLLAIGGKSQIITTIAGNGSAGFSGDGGPATAASFNQPEYICFDPAGNLYVTEYNNNRIRKIDRTGIITTYAGNGAIGYNGDSIQATSASLNRPQGITADAAGNIYFADVSNARVRKINTSGIISTVAGNGAGGIYTGDGVPATSTPVCTHYVAVDGSGNLYLSETSTAPRIRKVAASSGIISTFAGDGTIGYDGDGGPATAAHFETPTGIFADASGNVFFADETKNVVRKIASTGIITTVAGNDTSGGSGDGGSATAARLSYPINVFVNSSGDLFISDLGNNKIRVVSSSGIISTIAGNGHPGYSGDGGPAAAACLLAPMSARMDASGNLYICDAQNNVIRKVTGLTSVSNVARQVSNVAIMPNPAHDEFSLNSREMITNVLLFNASGQLVLRLTPDSKTVTINIAYLQRGIYTVVINGSEVKQVVKE